MALPSRRAPQLVRTGDISLALVSEIIEQFDVLDADDSGTISRDEMCAAAPRRARRSLGHSSVAAFHDW